MPWYDTVKDDVVVIVASKDQDANGMKGSFPDDSPFLAFKFGDEHIASMSSSWAIGGVPYLSVINLDGKLIEQEGDAQLGAGAAVVDQWVEKGKTL